MEIQQSSLYAQYIARLGWQVVRADGVNMFLRNFPVIGGLAKIQRPKTLPRFKTLLSLLKNYRVRTLAVEPEYTVDPTSFRKWCETLSRHVRVNRTPFLPTKTLRIDLTPTEEAIFKKFSETKRRAVRRALKHHVLIKESSDIHVLIDVKNKSSGFLGFITTTGIDKLWPIFAPDHAAILLAYKSSTQDTGHSTQVIGGVLLIFWDKIVYYWIAGATREGKKLFAPSLLVWEALKLAKQCGCKQFDFVGVWDERLPKENKAWLGFTKFKEGFGGKEIYYPIFSKRS